MTRFKLHYKLRESLTRFIAHKHDSRLVVRAHALLWCDQGVSVQEIARRLRTTRQTVYNWIQRFKQRQDLPLEYRLADATRSGRPATAKGIIDPLLEEILEQDPRQWGYRYTIWTASLLVTHLHQEHDLIVSPQSIHLALTRLGIRWKRPRHSLGLRSQTWRQAKGGLKRGYIANPAP